MGHRFRQRLWISWVAAFALTALTLGVGFCLFDGLAGATHDHTTTQDPSQDLCCGLMAPALAVALPAIGAMNPVVVESPPAVYLTSLRGIDPPPKRLSLS